MGGAGVAYQSFEELEVQKKGCRDYGQKERMTRAAGSIPSNIAEGAERESSGEFIRFLHIAKGLAAKLRTHTGLYSGKAEDKAES